MSFSSTIPILSRVEIRTPLNTCQRSILRYLAKKYSSTGYKLADKLEKKTKDRLVHRYSRSYVYRMVNNLLSRKFIEVEEEADRLKNPLILTFTGAMQCLATNILNAADIKHFLVKHQKFFPFSTYWKEISEIVDENQAKEALCRTAQQLIYRTIFRRFELGFGLSFESAIPIEMMVEDYFDLSQQQFDEEKRTHRNEKLVKLLSTHKDLLNSYVSYLAIQDIVLFVTGRLSLDKLDEWLSEKELAFFEDRNVQANSIFPDKRLNEFFPKYAEKRQVLTGMLMDNLLWKKNLPKKKIWLERDRFKISQRRT